MQSQKRRFRSVPAFLRDAEEDARENLSVAKGGSDDMVAVELLVDSRRCAVMLAPVLVSASIVHRAPCDCQGRKMPQAHWKPLNFACLFELLPTRTLFLFTSNIVPRRAMWGKHKLYTLTPPHSPTTPNLDKTFHFPNHPATPRSTDQHILAIHHMLQHTPLV